VIRKSGFAANSSRPFVAAHEWSHLAGYANEAEANFKNNRLADVHPCICRRTTKTTVQRLVVPLLANQWGG
jgi:hypothetical protein